MNECVNEKESDCFFFFNVISGWEVCFLLVVLEVGELNKVGGALAADDLSTVPAVVAPVCEGELLEAEEAARRVGVGDPDGGCVEVACAHRLDGVDPGVPLRRRLRKHSEGLLRRPDVERRRIPTPAARRSRKEVSHRQAQ